MNRAMDVLVIEDGEFSREVIPRILQQEFADIRAMTITSGKAAMKFLADCKVLPKILLLDSRLSDMDAFELLRHIRLTERTKSMPTFLVTDPMDAEARTLGRRLMVNGYIPRTTDAHILAERLTILRHLVGPHREAVDARQ